MLEPSELRQFFPVIATPSHDGKFFQNYVVSMMNFAIQAERAGMRLQVLFHQGESLVTRAAVRGHLHALHRQCQGVARNRLANQPRSAAGRLHEDAGPAVEAEVQGSRNRPQRVSDQP
ncbi:hypothetical protein [Variovorax paradoxus]|uniref:hypothetical protein n=1 Tax=Variovorax paradoxus TaxID=34073 RepID=UPI0027D8B1FE|nr:hypothetical protein [Variovorax paradoxus]